MHLITSLRSAFGFLTRVPVGPWPLQQDLHGISAWLPLVGLVVGAFVGGCTLASSYLFPPFICGMIGCASWVLITGGLHLDGVADCGDGLLVETTKERRLEIMKDSRLGTFGGMTLFFNLAFKVATLSFLVTLSPWYLLEACTLAGLLARAQIFIAMRCPNARLGGMGDAFRQGTRPYHAIIAAILTLSVCTYMGVSGYLALSVCLFTSACLLAYACRRLGGVTGDVFGCSVEFSEWIVLLTFCAYAS